MTTMPSPLNEIEFVLVSTFPLHLQTDLKSIIFFIVTFSNLCHSNWFVQNWPCDNWSEASQLPPWNLFQFQSICLTSQKDLSNHEIYFVVKQYNWLCHKIGLRPQTFHLEPSFISKQFCNTSWISIQAKLHHYATINSWFHQNMRREYPFMCKAGRPRCKINSIIKYSFLDAKVSQACVAAWLMGDVGQGQG